MTRVAGDLVGWFEAIAREGRIARARSVARELNPHRQHSKDRYPVFGRPQIDEMLGAWWRGWDETDRDLRGGDDAAPARARA